MTNIGRMMNHQMTDALTVAKTGQQQSGL